MPKIAVYKLSITTINDLLFLLLKLYNLNRFFILHTVSIICAYNLPLYISMQKAPAPDRIIQKLSQVNHKHVS